MQSQPHVHNVLVFLDLNSVEKLTVCKTIENRCTFENRYLFGSRFMLVETTVDPHPKYFFIIYRIAREYDSFS